MTDCRVVEKARRFAFVECKDPQTARRLLDKLDGETWFGERLVVNTARPRTSRAEDRREAYEKLAEHVEKREQAKVEARAKKRQAERDAWEKEHGPRVRAEKAAAKAQGHFGHGFGSDGRPLLHSIRWTRGAKKGRGRGRGRPAFDFYKRAIMIWGVRDRRARGRRHAIELASRRSMTVPASLPNARTRTHCSGRPGSWLSPPPKHRS